MVAMLVSAGEPSVIDGKYYPRWDGRPRAVGINAFDNLGYYASTAWLNCMKQAGSNTPYSPWFCGKSGSFDTGEQAYLDLDSDGYPMSLNAVNAPSGYVQQFTFLFTYIYNHMPPLAPGQATQYTAGGYTVEVSGPGVFTWTGDVVASSLASQSGALAISGSQITSTLAVGQTGTFTFNATGNGGFVLTIPANSGISHAGYLKFPYCVPTAYLSQYLAGDVVHPAYKAAILGSGYPGYNGPIRFMDALRTNMQDAQASFTANLAQGATAATLLSLVSDVGNTATWPYPTRTSKFAFANGQVVDVNCTYGQSGVVLQEALTSAVATNAQGAMAFTGWTWADRKKMSNFSWAGTPSPPIEAIVCACNELGRGPWFNVPGITKVIDATYLPNLAAMLRDGTGADVSNSNQGSFAGLSEQLRMFIEYTNECWGTFRSTALCQMMSVSSGFYAAQGNNSYYGGQEWYGRQVADICDTFKTAFGASFSSRVCIVMMNQFAIGNGTGFAKTAMNTPNAADAAYTHGIGAYGFAPYFGIDGISGLTASVTTQPTGTLVSGTYYVAVTGGSGTGATAVVTVSGGAVSSVGFSPCGSGYKPNDVLTVPISGTGGATSNFTVTVTGGDAQVIMALPDPVGEVYSIAYSNHGASGNVYGSVSATGWAYDTYATAQSWLQSMVGQPWYGLPVVCYEGGSALDDSKNIGLPWRTVLTNVQRDARFKYLFYDPARVLSAARPGYLEDMRSLGIRFVCQFNLEGVSIEQQNQAGAGGWGTLESPMQTLSPLSSAPSKYQGQMDFVAAGVGSGD